MNSVSFCTPEMLAKFRKISLLTDYIDEKEKELNAYNEAVRERYRFFSFGDAMFLY